MSKLTLIVIGLALTMASPQTWAHGGDKNHHHHHGHHHEELKPEFTETCEGAEADTVKNLLYEFHEVLHSGEHHHGLIAQFKNAFSGKGFREWMRGFRLSEVATPVCRFYLAKRISHPKASNHLANFAFLFPLSHVAEMLSGPLLTGLSVSQGWPAAVTGALGVTGLIISIPGLDPLCLFIFASYPIKIVQKTVTILRKASLAVAGFSLRVSGTKMLVTWAMDKAWLAQAAGSGIQINKLEKAIEVSLSSGQHFQLEISSDQTSVLSMEFDSKWMEEITFEDLGEQIKLLPLLTRQAILEMHQLAHDEDKRKPFYVEGFDKERVRWVPGAVPAGRLLECAELLDENEKARRTRAF